MDTAARLDAKPLYRHLDRLFGAVDGQRSRKKVMESFLDEFFRTLKDDLHLRGGVVYEPRRDDIALLRQVGDVGGVSAETLDPELPPAQLIFRHGVYIFAEPGW